ncbi:UTP--glucose-1-phosphate uridylyltransferase GalU [Patescibacteria group bacterium]|nr:UTP--glucose-1-phosphate uridylyltransferase GalU [Patescibacteria group bacterium]
MTQRIRKAIFPAAGFGTRFLPATKAQPKEMLPIVDKPVIQYLVEEAVASGIEEIIIITGRGKRAIEDHFDYSFELEHTLVEKNKQDLLETVRKVSNLAKFVYVRQQMPLGDGHAILCAKDLIGDEPFAVMFGDDIVDNEIPALKQLMNVYEKTGSPVIGLTQVPKDETQNYGVVSTKNSDGRLHELQGLVEKPKPEDAPSNLAIIGKYILTPDALRALENAEASPDGEIRLIDGFREFIKTQKIFGYELEGKRYDTGNKFGLIQATIDFALKRKGLDKQVRQYLRSLDLS